MIIYWVIDTQDCSSEILSYRKNESPFKEYWNDIRHRYNKYKIKRNIKEKIAKDFLQSFW
ncbi:hypothetical protein NWP96_03825 [Mycoplasmopsis cynos]|nr:hypothetical protein [Mycoplasmopsis cynos]